MQESLAGLRGRVGEAEQLYAELQGGIQHAFEVRRLEAGVESVTSWVLGSGADLLRQLILRGIGQDPDTVLSLQKELEQLELKCRVKSLFYHLFHRTAQLYLTMLFMTCDFSSTGYLCEICGSAN